MVEIVAVGQLGVCVAHLSDDEAIAKMGHPEVGHLGLSLRGYPAPGQDEKVLGWDRDGRMLSRRQGIPPLA